MFPYRLCWDRESTHQLLIISCRLFPKVRDMNKGAVTRVRSILLASEDHATYS